MAATRLSFPYFDEVVAQDQEELLAERHRRRHIAEE
jgi:hypothetical protein